MHLKLGHLLFKLCYEFNFEETINNCVPSFCNDEKKNAISSQLYHALQKFKELSTEEQNKFKGLFTFKFFKI